MSDNIEKRPPFESGSKIKYVEAPDPSWHAGDGMDHGNLAESWKKAEDQGWKVLRPDDHTSFDYYRILKSGVIPRPVAFVSSISEDGIPNLAPFSFFNMVSENPPVLLFSGSPRTTAEKDTIQNIRENSQFTVNPGLKQQILQRWTMPAEVSEWTATGLSMMESILVKPAWVRETAFAMECELFQFVEIPKPTATQQHNTIIVMGHIKVVHVRNAVLNERGTVNPTLLRPLARLGGYSYGVLGQVFDLPTPSWGDHEKEIMALEKKKAQEIANGSA